MQALKTLVFLLVVVAFLGLVSAAPAENEAVSYDQQPAMILRTDSSQSSDLNARFCTFFQCTLACQARGWRYGVCLNASWCLCHN